MITIKAKIFFYKDKGRTQPIQTGYRPLFNFTSESKKSGSIILINQKLLEIGKEGEVYIKFLNNDFLGKNFSIGSKFTFDEGTYSLGEGEILEIDV